MYPFRTKSEIVYLKEQYLKGNKEPLNEYVEELFKYYRQTGFPYFYISSIKKHEIIENLKRYNNKRTEFWDETGTIIIRNQYGYNLANSYHPQMQEVRSDVGNGVLCYAPMNAFNSDPWLKQALMKCIKLCESANPSILRNVLNWCGAPAGLKLEPGVYVTIKRVSNFRPLAALALYDRYLKTLGDVYDPSMGYSGRLIGAMVCPKVKMYYGTDPAIKQHEGANNFIKDFPQLCQGRYKFILDGSENADKYIPEKSIDFIFTSPPYFNCERYSDEKTQSWKKFPTKDAWMNGFMRKTLENCSKIIKGDGYIAINIAKVKSYPNIEEDFVKTAESIGLELKRILKLELMSLSLFKSGGKNGAKKYEPIFIFQNKGCQDWDRDFKIKKISNKLSSFMEI